MDLSERKNGLRSDISSVNIYAFKLSNDLAMEDCILTVYSSPHRRKSAFLRICVWILFAPFDHRALFNLFMETRASGYTQDLMTLDIWNK